MIRSKYLWLCRDANIDDLGLCREAEMDDLHI